MNSAQPKVITQAVPVVYISCLMLCLILIARMSVAGKKVLKMFHASYIIT